MWFYLTPPSTTEKYGVFTEYFFEERSRRCCGNRTATLDRERSEVFTKWREGLAACNGNRKSEASAEQIYKVSVSVPIEVDGWAKEQPLKK
jgi:hypothetical protein